MHRLASSFLALRSRWPWSSPWRAIGSATSIVLLFLVAQLLDFVFTYLGVVAFGVREGNPLLEHSMQALGLGTSLAIAKLVAVAGASTLHLLSFHRLLATLTAIYLALAILPWTWVLFVMN